MGGGPSRARPGGQHGGLPARRLAVPGPVRSAVSRSRPGRATARAGGGTGGVNVAVFSPDGRKILSGHGRGSGLDYSLRLWDAGTGRELGCFKGHTQEVNGLAFTPDGRHLLSAGDHTVRMWDAAT